MEDSQRKLLYDKVANHIQERSEEINEILSNCSITPKFVSQENQNKLEEILNLDTSSVVRNVSCDEFYDPEFLESIFKFLGTQKPKPQQQHQPRLFKATSQRTLSMTSLALSESDHQENVNDVKRQILEVQNLLENLNDSPLTIPNMNKIAEQETEKKSKFIELVFSLQKLAKELQSIAATDNLKDKESKTPLPVTKDLLDDLNHLSQVRCFSAH